MFHVLAILRAIFLAELVNRMVSLDVGLRPASATQIKQQLQHIARIWLALHANFGLVGPRYLRLSEKRPPIPVDTV
jgi:hypothetical protein